MKREFKDGVWVNPRELKLSRSQRRQVKKNAEEMDRTTAETDRRFFERFPHRRFRMRLPGQAEIDQSHILGGESAQLPPGFRHFLIINHVAPGIGFKILAQIRIGCGIDDIDLPEREIAEIWEGVAARHPQVREAAEAMRQVAEKRP